VRPFNCHYVRRLNLRSISPIAPTATRGAALDRPVILRPSGIADDYDAIPVARALGGSRYAAPMRLILAIGFAIAAELCWSKADLTGRASVIDGDSL